MSFKFLYISITSQNDIRVPYFQSYFICCSMEISFDFMWKELLLITIMMIIIMFCIFLLSVW